MKRALGVLLLAGGIAAGSGASALERSATTTVTMENGTIVSTAEGAFDPATGAFSRTGEATLVNGRTVSYAVSGACVTATSTCTFSGTAEGPFGGAWSFEGSLVQAEDGSSLSADVVTPTGRHVTVERAVTGDVVPLRALLQP